MFVIMRRATIVKILYSDFTETQVNKQLILAEGKPFSGEEKNYLVTKHKHDILGATYSSLPSIRYRARGHVLRTGRMNPVIIDIE